MGMLPAVCRRSAAGYMAATFAATSHKTLSTTDIITTSAGGNDARSSVYEQPSFPPSSAAEADVRLHTATGVLPLFFSAMASDVAMLPAPIITILLFSTETTDMNLFPLQFILIERSSLARLVPYSHNREHGIVPWNAKY